MLGEASKRRLSVWLIAAALLVRGGEAPALELNFSSFNSCVDTYGLFFCQNYFCPQCGDDNNNRNKASPWDPDQWRGDQWEGGLLPKNDYSASVLPWGHEWAEVPKDGAPIPWSYKFPAPQGPAAGDPGSGGPSPGAPKQPSRNIVETGYQFLFEARPEKPDYGLYSYLILADRSPIRAASIIDEILNATPSADALSVEPQRLNVLYLPAKSDFDPRDRFHESDYNYDLARRLLDKICLDPPAKLKELCLGDLSRGPYIFTYAKAAGGLARLPPPLLVVDMSGLNEHGFKTMLACYKAQVKRDDFSDEAKIENFSNGLLSVILVAADWDSSIEGSLKNMVHIVSEMAPKK